MATILGSRGLVLFGTGADSLAMSAVAETRNWDISMSPDFADDTVHGDTFRTKTPTFQDFSVSITALMSDVVSSPSNLGAKGLIAIALAKTSGKFYLYPDSSVTSIYWSGRGYIAIDSNAAPYDDFSQFNFSITAAVPPVYVGAAS
jgi:hypothetical protein